MDDITLCHHPMFLFFGMVKMSEVRKCHDLKTKCVWDYGQQH